MGTTQTAQAALTEPTRVSIACISCKARKRRCDGGTPKCANCVARGVECHYVAVRRTRGPGKRKNQDEKLEERLNTTQRNGVVEAHSTSLQSTTSMDSSQTQVGVRNRIPIFPDFLLPGIYDEHLKTFKRSMAEAIPTRNFMPLMPQHIARRLIENSFAEIMAEHQLMDLSNFVILLDAQYAASSRDPADNYARWAVINATIALAVRFKTAPGSEAAAYDITHGFYQNATRVLPELILQDPCLLSIQAMLAMAMFARNIPDIRAFIMLATNASRQLELLSLSGLSTDRLIDMEDANHFEQVHRTTTIFDKTIVEFLSTEFSQGTGLT